MDFRKFRPLHGWRVFIGEVGVILLGVLLALGAQQLAEDSQMRSEMRALRETIDHEIGLNLFAYDVRSRSGRCNQKRLDDLTGWLKAAQGTVDLPAIRPTPPLSFMPYRSAWDDRDPRVYNHLPLNVRQKYAEFYDELRNNSALIKDEIAAWSEVLEYSLPGPVSLADRRKMIGSLRRARDVQIIWGPNIEVSRQIARELRIKPARPDNVPPELEQWLAKCRPIFLEPPTSVEVPPVSR